MTAAAGGYAAFYWPLALTSVVMLLESQFQNGVLARYPDAERELATFALASSSFQFVGAMLAFVPQMVTVLARTPADRAMCRFFVNAIGVLLSLPLLAMGFTAAGQAALARLMNISPETLPAVTRYLQWLAPLVWVNAIRHYGTGILVLGRKTRLVTLLNAVHLAVLVGVLLAGRGAGIGALPTLALATVLSNVLHLVLVTAVSRKIAIPEAGGEGRPPVTLATMLHFFWPLAATSGLFAMSRPVLYAYINLAPNPVVTVAALRVAFDFGSIFQNPVNQFRHLYATFGGEDPRGVARFMFQVTGLLTLIMAACVFSPLSRLLFGRVLGLEGEVMTAAVQAVQVMCLVPAVICARNVYHGKMMVHRKTVGMALAALFRVLAMGLAAKIMLEAGWLDHVTGSVILVLGFVVEMAMVRHAVRRRRT